MLIALAVIAILIVGFYYYLQKRPATSLITSTGVGEELLSPQKEWSAQDHQQQPEDIKKNQALGQPPQGLPSSDTDGQINNQAESADTVSGEQAAMSGLSVNDTGTSGHIQQQIDIMNAFYTHLDQQPYFQDISPKEPSKVYFSKLLQKLANNPPTVIRETDNLYTLLQNTSHFFRLLGKKNIILSKKILATESKSFEQIVQAFYILTAHPEYLKKEYALSIPPQGMTDYAVFFLKTMGGRMYLFRRDSATRMVITYYAIKTLDRANISGNGGHGIDLRPAILALTEEMENGGKNLQLKEQYLDALYDLQEKYN